MKIKAVAFDMDGTLYSSEPLIENVYKETLMEVEKITHKKYKYPTFNEIEPLIGQPVKIIYETLFYDLSEKEKSLFGQIVLKKFQETIMKQGGYLFPKVKETIDFLNSKNLHVLIASNGKREYIDSILNKFSLNTEPFICVDESPSIQKKADILKYYLKEYQLQKDEIIMVGDRTSDYDAANELGIFFVGCNFGHGHISEIKNAHIIIQNIHEVIKIIENKQGDHVA